jgi:hypothetical protein
MVRRTGGLERAAGDRPYVGVPQPNAAGQVSSGRVHRGVPVDVQASQQARFAGVGQPGHRHAPATRRESHPGVMQGGATADHGEPAARIRQPRHPGPVGEQLQPAGGHVPSPWSPVVRRRRPVGRDDGPVESLVHEARADRTEHAGQDRGHRTARRRGRARPPPSVSQTSASNPACEPSGTAGPGPGGTTRIVNMPPSTQTTVIVHGD